jgi:outer membrane lipoprotein-sorting protein
MTSKLLIMAVAAVIFLTATGQAQNNGAQPAGFKISQLPPEFQPIAVALGDRLQRPGKERMTLNGTLTQNGSPVQVKVTYELPNKYRIDWNGSPKRSTGFDGQSAWASDGNLSDSDKNTMESFLDDSPEALFYALTERTSFRVIAHRARMDDGSTLNYKGPWATIFQTVGSISSSGQKTVRQRHFYFDSQTHLPMTVRYLQKTSGGSVIPVETSHGTWTQSNGQQVPGTITRSESGKQVFGFSSTGATFSPAGNDGFFSHN